MSIITLDLKRKDPPRGPPTSPLSSGAAQRIENRIEDRMKADPDRQRRKLEAEQEASRQRSTGKPKHYPEPTPIRREDRTSTFEKGAKLIRRVTNSVLGRTSLSAK